VTKKAEIIFVPFSYRFCTLNDKPNFLTRQCAALLAGVARGDCPVRLPPVTTLLPVLSV